MITWSAYGLRKPEEIAMVCHTDATSYAEMLEEVLASARYTSRPYGAKQRKAGRMWAAAQAYRTAQKGVRTPAAWPGAAAGH